MNPLTVETATGVDPYEVGRQGLAALLDDQPAFRVRQVWSWLCKGVDDPDRMTDLPAGLRARLRAAFVPPPEVLGHTTADAGLTHKVLLRVGGAGRAAEAVESVLMTYPRQAGRQGRATVCVSTQAGCALACPFCATGQAGLRRQLTLGEVVRQVTTMQGLLGGGPGHVPEAVPDHVTNVVFMGMGEPLANLDVTIDAVRWLHDPEGFGLSARSITVSTVGLVPGIRRLAALGLPITLAVSLHAPDDALRDDLVPVNRQFPLADLLAACREYREATGRRMTFEYVLIAGVNDAPGQARELADLVRGERAGRGPLAHVNLIPMNPTPAVAWEAPAPAGQRAFRDVLVARGIPATIRRNRGGDIDAACGQLAAAYAVGSGRMLPAAATAWRRWDGLPLLRDAR
jgi:23S rRNA (adenine2503-C2)-methyltransferase